MKHSKSYLKIILSKLPLEISLPEPESNPLGILLSGQTPFNYTIYSFSILNNLYIFIILETNLTLFLSMSLPKA
jgi:hypothetical protein